MSALMHELPEDTIRDIRRDLAVYPAKLLDPYKFGVLSELIDPLWKALFESRIKPRHLQRAIDDLESPEPEGAPESVQDIPAFQDAINGKSAPSDVAEYLRMALKAWKASLDQTVDPLYDIWRTTFNEGKAFLNTAKFCCSDKGREPYDFLIHDLVRRGLSKFISVGWRYNPDHPNQASLKTWMTVVMENFFRDLLDSKEFRQSEDVSLDNLAQDDVSLSTRPALSDELELLCEDAWRAYWGTSPDEDPQYIAFRMKHFEGRIYKEISAELGVCVTTAHNYNKVVLEGITAAARREPQTWREAIKSY